MTKSLLPPGCYDLLPPQAGQKTELAYKMLSLFESFGYEQIAPSLMEYSESLLEGRGRMLSQQIFRVMDPISHKFMGIRSDITPQVARIAMTRLKQLPRPLRLCYSDSILKMRGERTKNNRQLHQVGIELIGAAKAGADAEVILIMVKALQAVGISNISLDLNLPGIVSSLLRTEKFDEEKLQELLAAVARKDISSVSNIQFTYQETLIGLLRNIGAAETMLPNIERLDLPDSARRECADLRQVIDILKKHGGDDLKITIDATESYSEDYHLGIGFSIFVDGVTYEVGRGGRYRIQGATAESDIEATGFTLYMETLLDILPKPPAKKRILISEGIDTEGTEKLRNDGFVLIHAVEGYGNCKNEAKRLGCGYIYTSGEIVELS
ncbi:MAG: ATP phosphoribosyltransferase regulatory subunit [Rickettsiales bacterium]